ncbi:uncharacterized protein LOC128959393 [Oppia nitens]|uniref:uncharacterized protein LOC128959393 n=1 Tax=Oppia nitens TaxID=1686743 RepID=UPI0023DC5A4C|nr:uncharacterized protein LOC128959393 [Oppia nitens]
MHNKLLLIAQVVCVCLYGVETLGPSCGGKSLTHGHQSDYWLHAIKHEGWAPFHSNPGQYRVFRNVRDYGAKGDGNSDDWEAINRAITDGGRCGHGCGSTTVSPAIVYFPPGQYLVGRPLQQYYYTEFIGDPSNLPTIIMSPSNNGPLIDASGWEPTCNFFRAVRNLRLDLTRVDAYKHAVAINWPIAQATSITNVHIRMSTVAGNNHVGLVITSGSGGYFGDMTIDGGRNGMELGNQQITSRNISISHANTAIVYSWTWGWTLKNIRIDSCNNGIDMSSGGENWQKVGAIMLVDSEISNTAYGIRSASTQWAKPAGGGALIIDNVKLTNVQHAVAHSNGQVVLEGGNKVISQWGQGRFYSGQGENGQYKQGELTPPTKPQALLDSTGRFFEKSRPLYDDIAAADFVSVKSEGAKGDGRTDDTQAIQQALNKWAGCRVIYFPFGEYVITDTIVVPPDTRVIGEVWSVILARGDKFADMNNPRPAIKVGNPGDTGVAEFSSLVIGTQGAAPGAILMQVNMRDPQGEQGAVGIWDVHFRVGGTVGTDLEGNCNRGGGIHSGCTGSFLLLHVAATGSLYVENMWAWLADHDLDGRGGQVSIGNGRGVLIESSEGPVWIYGPGSEHNILYQFNIVNAKNVWMGLIQTETPYYQGNPPAPQPFHSDSRYHDPDFGHCGDSHTCAMAWGLRIVSSENIFIYGAGLYNFFQDYGQCWGEEHCQDNMVSIEKSNKNVHIYGLSTKNANYMVAIDGQSRIGHKENKADFCSTIAAYSSN